MARRKHNPQKRRKSGQQGRVVETRGRRVLVRDDKGERVCFLKGMRAVVGDRVLWDEVPGSGGTLVEVLDRDTTLTRVDHKGREQIIAANLTGLFIVASVQQPEFRAGLVDRYIVAARSAGLDVALVLNKWDLGLSEAGQAEVALRQATGLPVLQCSATTGEGLDGIRGFVDDNGGSWALVGHSGVGKTSLIAALLPEQDVGPVGAISDYWGAGQHTTTNSRIFALPGGELVDSPGIRTFAPGGLEAEWVRVHFPGIEDVVCQYRNCLHRPGEDGCRAEDEVHPDLLASYRRILDELLAIEARRRP